MNCNLEAFGIPRRPYVVGDNEVSWQQHLKVIRPSPVLHLREVCTSYACWIQNFDQHWLCEANIIVAAACDWLPHSVLVFTARVQSFLAISQMNFASQFASELRHFITTIVSTMLRCISMLSHTWKISICLSFLLCELVCLLLFCLRYAVFWLLGVLSFVVIIIFVSLCICCAFVCAMPCSGYLVSYRL